MSVTQFKIIIVDDEPDGRGIIKGLLLQYFPEILIVAEAGGVTDAVKALTEHEVDVYKRQLYRYIISPSEPKCSE